MTENILTQQDLCGFRAFLLAEEKSRATIEKYHRDAAAFLAYCESRSITRETVIAYKQHLVMKGYAVRSINSMLASLNSFLLFCGRPELRIKPLKIQQQAYRPEGKDLSRIEYERLCHAAQRRKNERLYLILQTLCGTGMRVSELPFITAEAVKRGEAVISLKGKTRSILIVKALQKKLLCYISKRKIQAGPVFITRTGAPVNRSNIWREMKKLCRIAGVSPAKVFPHNLRHLFARMFYALGKDIAKLADLLGHSSINTTRLYIISSGREHRRLMEAMRLIL